jgi:hypothetical protein
MSAKVVGQSSNFSLLVVCRIVFGNPQPTVHYGFWMPFLIGDPPKKNQKNRSAWLNRGQREIGMPGMSVAD